MIWNNCNLPRHRFFTDCPTAVSQFKAVSKLIFDFPVCSKHLPVKTDSSTQIITRNNFHILKIFTALSSQPHLTHFRDTEERWHSQQFILRQPGIRRWHNNTGKRIYQRRISNTDCTGLAIHSVARKIKFDRFSQLRQFTFVSGKNTFTLIKSCFNTFPDSATVSILAFNSATGLTGIKHCNFNGLTHRNSYKTFFEKQTDFRRQAFIVDRIDNSQKATLQLLTCCYNQQSRNQKTCKRSN